MVLFLIKLKLYYIVRWALDLYTERAKNVELAEWNKYD